MIIVRRLICIGLCAAILSSCASLPRALKESPLTTGQALVVRSVGPEIFQAEITAWERQSTGWRQVFGPWPAVVGRNGFAPENEKREGDGRSPSGRYPIGLAFGREAVLKTGLVYRQSTTEDIWIDDAAFPQYNQWVQRPTEATSFEEMLREDGLYDAGAVIEYNTDPVVPGFGSAIFLHIWREAGSKPTAGCVALSKDRLLELLAWLDSERKPVIILLTPG